MEVRKFLRITGLNGIIIETDIRSLRTKTDLLFQYFF